MRVHVNSRKTENLEILEDTVGICLSDEAWNAFAKLSKVEITAITMWLCPSFKRLADEGKQLEKLQDDLDYMNALAKEIHAD